MLFTQTKIALEIRRCEGMKVKVYRVVSKKNPNIAYYMVDAPSKRIAKWCGANLYNSEYCAFLSANDMIAERFSERR